jgi:hypothetical protein
LHFPKNQKASKINKRIRKRKKKMGTFAFSLLEGQLGDMSKSGTKVEVILRRWPAG